VEVNEIGARLVRRYWLVLLIAIGAPILLVGGFVSRQPATYTAHARVMAATVVPQAQAQADAIVSQVQAIATSRDVVAGALAGAGLHRDAAAVVKLIRVAGVGSSGVVDISYADPSASMAQQVTAAVAAAVVGQLAGVHSGLPVVVDDLDALLAELADKRAALQAVTPATAANTQALASLDRVITDLTNDRAKLAQLAAVAAAPAIVDTAALPVPDSKGIATKLAVAGLLGLVLGLLFVGVNETLRPGVSGANRVARQLRVPMLGRLGSDPAALADIGRRLRLAGRRHGSAVLVLMRADGVTVTPELVERLETATLWPEPTEARVALAIGPAQPSPTGNGVGSAATQTMSRLSAAPVNGADPSHGGALRRICAFDELDPHVEGDDIGLVVLVGRHTRLGAIAGVNDLVSASGWPLLGVLDDPRNRSGV
jgi:capsular polysaccharide biosynthesis protein